MAKIRPIRASAVGSKKKKPLPDAVIESFNELIAEKFVDDSAKIL